MTGIGARRSQLDAPAKAAYPKESGRESLPAELSQVAPIRTLFTPPIAVLR